MLDNSERRIKESNLEAEVAEAAWYAPYVVLYVASSQVRLSESVSLAQC